MKEFVMKETEEMTTFGSVWKRYEPVKELVRCKDCRQNNQCSIQFKFADPDCPGEWYCAYGERGESSKQSF